MTEKRQFPKYDCDLFEKNGLDDASTVMQMFDRKNRRISRIFHRDDDNEEEEVDKNKSYGLHLISRRDSNSDKENTATSAAGKKSEVRMRTIRNLSPVDIVPANEEEINEPRASQQFKEPKAALPTRQNMSLRRSLFQQQTNSAVDKQLICSTPTTQRICSQESFFKTVDTISNLSPIRKTRSSSSNNDDRNVNDIEGVVTQKQTKQQSVPPQENVAVNSLAALENDLKEQYQLEIERTPNKKTRVSSRQSAKSFGSTQSTSKKNEHRTPASAQCSPKIKEFTVQVQPMDISEDVISNYRKNQLRRLSTSNQTDVNSLKIVETPISKHRLTSTKCDSLLARKLQQCESDSDMTEDEEVNHTPSQSNRKSAVKVAKLSQRKHASSSQVIIENVEIIRASVEQTEKSDEESEAESSADNDYESAQVEQSEKSDDESEVESSNNDYESAEVEDDEKDKTENSGKEKTENSERERAEDPESETNDDSDTEASKKSCDTVLFKKPTSGIAGAKNKKERKIITSNTSLESVHVSPSIVKSLTTFRKTTSENSIASQTQSESTSKRFTLPKRTKAKTKQPDPKISAYLKLSEKSKPIKKNKKDNKNEKNKKRTLYIQNLDDELETETQPNIEQSSSASNPLAHSNADKSIADSDCDLRDTVDRIRSSLQSMSSASSDFNAEIPEVEEEVLPSPPKKTTRKRNYSPSRSEEPPKSRRKKIKPVSADESDEEPPKSRRKKINKPTTSTADQELHTAEHSDAEQKKTRRKRIKSAAAEEEEQSEERDVDEGFSSDESTTVPDNVKYDPNKNGCLRRGLRVRRYPRAWWRHDAESQNYGLVYGCYNNKDYKAEVKLQEMFKTNQISKNQLFNNGLDPSTIDPIMALKKAREIVKQKSSAEPTKPKAKSSKKKVVLPAIEESDNTSHASETHSTCTFATAYSRSETIRKVFEGYAKSSEGNVKRMAQHNYALQQINQIEWTVCGANIMFYQFVTGESDGFIKFLPGSEKNRSKTKDSVLKFVLLTGKIDFIINGTEETIENLGFVSIAPGTTYTAKNPYDEPAILAFTRLPLIQENEGSVSKVRPFATS